MKTSLVAGAAFSFVLAATVPAGAALGGEGQPHQSAKRVEFKGPRKIYLGSSSACAPPPVKVEYR